jgi:hypothetical protein
MANSEIRPKDVPLSYDSSTAVVLLPPVCGRLGDRKLLRWLSQGQLEQLPAPVDSLAQVLGALGLEAPVEGLAALRMWGQTGDRPGTWLAAADPVFMEPQLDRLFLHALGPDHVSGSEMRRLFDSLQETLGADGAIGFAWLGACGYIRSGRPMVTAEESAVALDRQNPKGSQPPVAVAADTLRLVSEIEMALHEQAVNRERQVRGQPPVNSLWIWGGGYAPDQRELRVPPMFAEDPLLRGYWESVSGNVEAWPGTIGACLDAVSGGFVAEVPAGVDDAGALGSHLRVLRDALRSGRLSHVLIISADGIRATLRRSDRYRVWRRASGLFGEPPA